MPKYNKKENIALYIQEGDFKIVIETLTDPAPTIFEDTENTEVRFNVLLENQEDFLKYHALDNFKDKEVTIGVLYDSGIELKSTFIVSNYERRFGSTKGAIVTHVFKGTKQIT